MGEIINFMNTTFVYDYVASAYGEVLNFELPRTTLPLFSLFPLYFSVIFNFAILFLFLLFPFFVIGYFSIIGYYLFNFTQHNTHTYTHTQCYWHNSMHHWVIGTPQWHFIIRIGPTGLPPLRSLPTGKAWSYGRVMTAPLSPPGSAASS